MFPPFKTRSLILQLYLPLDPCFNCGFHLSHSMSNAQLVISFLEKKTSSSLWILNSSSIFFTFSDFLSTSFLLRAIFLLFLFNLSSPFSPIPEMILLAFLQKSQLTLLLVLFFQVVLPFKQHPRSSIAACSSQIFKTISKYSITRVVGSFLL